MIKKIIIKPFDTEFTFRKLQILKEELDILIKERDKSQKIFDEICDNIDSGISAQEVAKASSKLSIILDHSDVICEKLYVLKKIFAELKLELMN